MEQTIGSAFNARDNNFDLIRLVAAWLVIFSHSYPLTAKGVDPLVFWTGGHLEGGSMAVAAFFCISGFLVTRSLERNTMAAYMASRMLRIMPALCVVVVLQTLLLGACLTTLPVRDYFANPETWNGLRNVLIFDLREGLPGVFTTNPLTAVNGSLWTLPVETSFYLMLPLLALSGLLRRGRIAGMTLALFAGFLLASEVYGFSLVRHGVFVFWSVPFFPALNSVLYFSMGALLWVHRDSVPQKWRACGLLRAGVVRIRPHGHGAIRTARGPAVFDHLCRPAKTSAAGPAAAAGRCIVWHLPVRLPGAAGPDRLFRQPAGAVGFDAGRDPLGAGLGGRVVAAGGAARARLETALDGASGGAGRPAGAAPSAGKTAA